MIIIVINNKGGTGKTTTCANLSAALANLGYRVLLVDLDSQASASLSLGIGRGELAPSAADLLFDETSVHEVIRQSDIPGLDVITGEMRLVNADLILAETPGREKRLTDCLERVRGSYDFIFCDCPPSLSMLSINALKAADRFIIPVPPEYLALEGLVGMMSAVDMVRGGMGAEASLLGIVFTLANPITKITREIIALVREQYGNDVFETEIKRDVRLAEAPSHGKSVFEFAPTCRGAEYYMSLAREVLDRAGVKKGRRTGKKKKR